MVDLVKDALKIRHLLFAQQVVAFKSDASDK